MKSVGKKKTEPELDHRGYFETIFILFKRRVLYIIQENFKILKHKTKHIYVGFFPIPKINGSYYDLISFFINGVIFYYTETSNCGLQQDQSHCNFSGGSDR